MYSDWAIYGALTYFAGCVLIPIIVLALLIAGVIE